MRTFLKHQLSSTHFSCPAASLHKAQASIRETTAALNSTGLTNAEASACNSTTGECVSTSYNTILKGDRTGQSKDRSPTIPASELLAECLIQVIIPRNHTLVHCSDRDLSFQPLRELLAARSSLRRGLAERDRTRLKESLVGESVVLLISPSNSNAGITLNLLTSLAMEEASSLTSTVFNNEGNIKQ